MQKREDENAQIVNKIVSWVLYSSKKKRLGDVNFYANNTVPSYKLSRRAVATFRAKNVVLHDLATYREDLGYWECVVRSRDCEMVHGPKEGRLDRICPTFIALPRWRNGTSQVVHVALEITDRPHAELEKAAKEYQKAAMGIPGAFDAWEKKCSSATASQKYKQSGEHHVGQAYKASTEFFNPTGEKDMMAWAALTEKDLRTNGVINVPAAVCAKAGLQLASNEQSGWFLVPESHLVAWFFKIPAAMRMDMSLQAFPLCTSGGKRPVWLCTQATLERVMGDLRNRFFKRIHRRES